MKRIEKYSLHNIHQCLETVHLAIRYVGGKDSVKIFYVISHIHWPMLFRLSFVKVEISRNENIEDFQVLSVKIVPATCGSYWKFRTTASEPFVGTRERVFT